MSETLEPVATTVDRLQLAEQLWAQAKSRVCSWSARTSIDPIVNSPSGYVQPSLGV
jgi:hypothetical protein